MEIREDAAWVGMDGEYGQGIVIFDADELTDMQWEHLTDMHAGDRAEYVVAIINGDDERVKEMEEELL